MPRFQVGDFVEWTGEDGQPYRGTITKIESGRRWQSIAISPLDNGELVILPPSKVRKVRPVRDKHTYPPNPWMNLKDNQKGD